MRVKITELSEDLGINYEMAIAYFTNDLLKDDDPISDELELKKSQTSKRKKSG